MTVLYFTRIIVLWSDIRDPRPPVVCALAWNGERPTVLRPASARTKENNLLAWLGIWPIDTYFQNLVNVGLLFRGIHIFHGGYLAHFCRSASKFSSVRGIGAWQVLNDFGELWSGGPAIPCGDLHQSFTDTLVLMCPCFFIWTHIVYLLCDVEE